ncbi:UDP-glucose 4-epimerase GalE [Aurantimicrobium photophilum]|uniref:UDP-glucose 4-epimerase n=1 Tax=Aurantimicrobium photophilum TaxID=1987356 RepID=A0A2Z3RWX7_9MICO|nr:UDP-glucose 4-epimerase GalE [Aurantimicrobium photophilum]AWR21040.1 UDP-glucose 4-epimerase [Aurantimicrobium photophilum]
MRVLVTGGAGYIGSHTVLALLEQGHIPVVVDNLSNSSVESLNRVSEITGKPIEFHNIDLCDEHEFHSFLREQSFDAILHFAGFKAVGESVANPLKYYENNIGSTVSLLKAINASTSSAPPKVIFSSSATVYGSSTELPLTESSKTGEGITNPYGYTKFVCERILTDTVAANSAFQAIALRYFNPIGAHKSGRIGEDPAGIPNNLAPYITQVASGKLSELSVFGDDYDTADGTGIRDYIHVMDVAEGHVAALGLSEPGFHAVNLGTGQGTSVFELLTAFEAVVGSPIPYAVTPRRPGDIAACYADTSLAKKLLGWSSTRDISEACADAWRWQSQNPQGY